MITAEQPRSLIDADLGHAPCSSSPIPRGGPRIGNDARGRLPRSTPTCPRSVSAAVIGLDPPAPCGIVLDEIEVRVVPLAKQVHGRGRAAAHQRCRRQEDRHAAVQVPDQAHPLCGRARWEEKQARLATQIGSHRGCGRNAIGAQSGRRRRAVGPLADRRRIASQSGRNRVAAWAQSGWRGAIG